jgi:hypothetical protein
MIRDRNMLIEWLRTHSSRDRVIHNAAHTGRIESYGVFCSAPGSTSAGWVLYITTPQARYLVAVVENELHEWTRWYRIRRDQVDWSAWAGDQFQSELYQGDEPYRYQELRNEALKAASTPLRLSRHDPKEADPDLPPQAHGYPGDVASDRPVDLLG